jgi:hypothetical protein
VSHIQVGSTLTAPPHTPALQRSQEVRQRSLQAGGGVGASHLLDPCSDHACMHGHYPMNKLLDSLGVSPPRHHEREVPVKVLAAQPTLVLRHAQLRTELGLGACSRRICLCMCIQGGIPYEHKPSSMDVDVHAID